MASPRFVVCGDDTLAHSLTDELVRQYHAEVTVILPSRRRNHGPQLAAMSRVRIVEAERVGTEAFRAAKLDRATGLALVRQDDIDNIHAALCAKEVHPGVRLVIRMFNTSLSDGAKELIGGCTVLSDASIAAPELVAAALGEIAPNFVELSGRTLRVARRTDVDPQDLICGIAATDPRREPEVLPVPDDRSNLVLAVANRDGPRADRAAVRRVRRQARRRRRILALSRALVSVVDSKLEIALLVLVVILLGGMTAIAVIDGVTLWQALYTTAITATDAGDANLGMGLARQLTHATVAVAGIALVPVLTAAIVNASVNARLAATVGRLRQPMAGHVVVAGLGDLGTRVIWYLHELGHDVVAIDQSESSRGAQFARELGIPLVVGDAGRAWTLRQASVGTCQALLALSTSDELNLGAALHARTVQPDLRVVLRLFDSDFAGRVERAFETPIASRSVSALAAPAFAVALLGRKVIGTIAVERQVLVVAEVPVTAESELDGKPLEQIARVGEVRVIAFTAARDEQPAWKPAPTTVVQAGDRLVVVATDEALGRLLSGGPQT